MSKCIRLYRFYNLDKDEHGAPFAKCDDHIDAYKKGQKPPAPQLILEKIADQAVWPCVDCEAQEFDRAERVRFAAAAREPSVTQDGPIWSLTLKTKNDPDGLTRLSDGWSFRDDCSDVDQEVYAIVRKTRPVREEC